MSRGWLPSFMSGSSSVAPQQGETASNNNSRSKITDQMVEVVEDDDWSDVSSIDGISNSSNSSDRPSDGSMDAATKARLFSSMPSLFSTDLPPCGLHPQCAFENINNRLRKLWLQKSLDPTITVRIVDLCKIVYDDLDAENQKHPQGTLRFTESRRPWRHEGVFFFELLWSKWFFREAEIQERLPHMDENELDSQAFMDRVYPIPKELRFTAKGRVNKKGILALWRAWSRAKRGLPPVIEALDVPVTTEDMSLGGVVREALKNVNNPRHEPAGNDNMEIGFITDAREVFADALEM